jgi:hypothetical protein
MRLIANTAWPDNAEPYARTADARLRRCAGQTDSIDRILKAMQQVVDSPRRNPALRLRDPQFLRAYDAYGRSMAAGGKRRLLK